MFVPYGTFTAEEAEATFVEQAQALAEGGADVLWIETIFAFAELEAAIAAASSTGLPMVSTMTFDTVGRTMMGDTRRRRRGNSSNPWIPAPLRSAPTAVPGHRC
jgi:5-methyltetrahydrofolate--homocysteine methyltransferase